MKKRYLVLLILFVLAGCTQNPSDKEDIDFNESENIEERYEFSHGVVDYDFEIWEFNNTSLKFDYEISNLGKESQLGLVFFIDGLPQEYTSNGKKTTMETVDMDTGDQVKLSIELVPQLTRELSETNINPVLILNPSNSIDEIRKYGVNHMISSTATIRLNIKSNTDKNILTKNIDIETSYDEIDKETLSMFVKDDINMLESDVYIHRDDDDSIINRGEKIKLSILGKEGNYKLLTVKDNRFTESYNIETKDGKMTNLEMQPDLDDVTNLYYLIVPTDVQDIHEYIMINQSSRWVVK